MSITPILFRFTSFCLQVLYTGDHILCEVGGGVFRFLLFRPCHPREYRVSVFGEVVCDNIQGLWPNGLIRSSCPLPVIITKVVNGQSILGR